MIVVHGSPFIRRSRAALCVALLIAAGAGCAADSTSRGAFADRDSPTASSSEALTGALLDLAGWCTATQGSGAALGLGSGSDPYSWTCQGVPIDMGPVCRWQYGGNAYPVLGSATNAYSWTCTNVAQSGFTDANGWKAITYAHAIRYADVNGDGNTDVCGRGYAGVYCATYAGNYAFSSATLWTSDFSDAEGWGPAEFTDTIQLADVNGDGKADLCGRGYAGVYCALSTGGSFGAPVLWTSYFSDAEGWGNLAYADSIRLGDVNGDGKADLCGRGVAGVLCSLSSGTGFATPTTWETTFSDALGWAAAGYGNTMQLGDLDGDGRADVCARGSTGVMCEKSSGSAFGPATLAVDNFRDAYGWNGAAYADTIRIVPAMNGHDARICGRGGAGVYCAERQPWADILSFSPVVLQDRVFGDAAGWASDPSYYETMGFGIFTVPEAKSPTLALLCGRSGDGITCDGQAAVAPTSPAALCAEFQGLPGPGAPKLPPLGSVTLGTYDVGNNLFTWDPGIPTKSKRVCEIVDDPKPHLVCHTEVSRYYVPNAIDEQYTVNLVNNAQTSVALSIVHNAGDTPGPGQQATAVAGAPAVTLTGFFGGPSWIGIQGVSSVGQALDIERGDFVESGCFTLPALPVGVVYQPTVPGSYSTMTFANSVGAQYTNVTATVSGMGVQNTTISGFDDASKAVAALAGMKIPGGVKSGGASPGAVSSASTIISDFLSLLAQGLASQDAPGAQENETLEVTTDHTIAVNVTDSITFSSVARDGVGAGDKIVFLPNVRIAYYNYDGQVTYVPLGHDYKARALEVAQLQPGGDDPAMLPDAVRAQLLALDPVASSGTSAVLDTSRFTFAGDADQSDVGTDTFTHSTTVTDTTVSTNVYKTNGLDGSFINLELGAGSGVSMGNTISTSLTMPGPSDVPTYLDKVFGTFAFGPPIAPQ